MLQANKKNCEDCLPYEPTHLQNWLSDIVELILTPIFRKFISSKILSHGEKIIDNLLLAINFFSLDKYFRLSEINHIAAIFIAAGKNKGIEFQVFQNALGYSDYFRMKVGNRYFDFEKLPRAEHTVKNKLASQVDDKWVVKRKLAKAGLPIVEGKVFWWFQKGRALSWARSFGFPLILKPRRGSLSQHIYFNLQNETELEEAIKKVNRYSPVFLLERFLPNLNLFRITVVDGERIFAVKRLPPKITGDGKSKVSELMAKINFPDDNVNRIFLREQGFGVDSILKANETVYLHNKIVLSLGAEIEDATAEIHLDNLAMFKKIVEIFGNRLIGIDFLSETLKKSWRDQRCAVIELNSLPNIRMHDFKEDGETKNKVAEALVDLVFKYYR